MITKKTFTLGRKVHKQIIVVENNKKRDTFCDLLDSSFLIFSTGGKIKKEKTIKGWVLKDNTKKHLDEIKKFCINNNLVYIATDSDEIGERIAWEVADYLKYDNTYRILPEEISEEAILNSIKHATKTLDKNKINMQVAKKMIERLISKDISGLLQFGLVKEDIIEYNENSKEDIEKLKNIGIGRISAPALALIMEAEERIDTFIPETYKKVAVDYFKDNIQFTVKSRMKFTKETKEELLIFMNMLNKEQHIIESYEKTTKDTVPPSPLNSIWLQRSANYQFGFSPKETMDIAKELYEGVAINGKKVSLITYYKTNSKYFSNTTISKIIQVVLQKYGEDYAFLTPRLYTKKESTREAIRPVDFVYEPEHLKPFLKEKHFLLYEYIYYRTIATQMKSAIYDQSELKISIGSAKFKATANKILFDGWKLIGKYWKDDDIFEREEVILPETLIPGKELKPIDIREYEIKERSPWRYGEGRFITTLEKHGIADSGSVSNVLQFLKQKGYIKITKGMIYPTETGRTIYYFLKQYVPWLIDLDYVEKFFKDLDLIEQGKKDKKELLLEYETLKNEAFLKLEYAPKDFNVESWAIKKAKKIAQQKGQSLTETVLNNPKNLMLYLKENEEEAEKLGTCPACSSGNIFQNEHGYKCDNPSCTFMLWNNNIESFLKNFSKYIPMDIIPQYISTMLKKGKCYIDNLYSKKKEVFFDAYVGIVFNNKYNNWQLSLLKNDFKKDKEESNCEPEINNKKDIEIKYIDIEVQNNILKEQIKREREEKRLIENASKKDALTRAYNRGCFDKDIKILFKKEKNSLSCVFVDGDKFKSINDTYGHDAGDEVLKFLVDKMFEGIKDFKRARVYRYGGEEFIILFVQNQKRDVINCINKIRISIEESIIKHNNQNIKITISAGISFAKQDDTIESFIKRADDGVYEAKETGRNKIVVRN